MLRLGREHDGRVLHWVAVFLVDGLLIDTGQAHCAAELEAFLAPDLAAKKITVAVNTHHHEDHIGGNKFLLDRGVRVFAHADAIELIARRPTLFPYQEMVWGYPEPTRPEPAPDEIVTPHHRFQVIPTPGHSHDHICLFEAARGWLFTGDLFISEKLKAVRSFEEVGQMATSLETLAGLPGPRLILFNAAGSVVEDGRPKLVAAAGYLRQVIASAKALAAEGLTPAQIRDRVFGRESLMAELTSGDCTTENLIKSALRAG